MKITLNLSSAVRRLLVVAAMSPLSVITADQVNAQTTTSNRVTTGSKPAASVGHKCSECGCAVTSGAVCKKCSAEHEVASSKSALVKVGTGDTIAVMEKTNRGLLHVEGSPFSSGGSTPLVVASTTHPEVDRQREQVLMQADKFLDGQSPDETHQGLVLRLLRQTVVADAASRTNGRASDLIGALRRQQRADGGWSQTADRTSDAFATGQTLYALGRTGLTADDPAIRRGIEFLVRTQQADGTWLMTSRPNPETGKPADFLNPITYAAAAWATLGLTTLVAK